MIFRSIVNLLSSKHVIARLGLYALMKHEGRLILYHAGIDTGLFALLKTPRSAEEIARELSIPEEGLLSSLLDLGRSLGEIACTRGTYRLQGAMAKALAEDIPLAALVRETARYHADVAINLGGYLMKGTRGDYLKEFGGVIAESSRILEPFIKAFIHRTVKQSVPLTILEVGCGAGEYLKYYVEINRDNGGLAVDIDESAVTIARRRIRDNGIDGNFTVTRDDIMNPVTLGGRTFDLVTTFSNMHYFPHDDRGRLFAAVHGLLNDGGRFMVAAGLKEDDLSSSYYDLVFSATRGLHPLPRKADMVRALRQAGFPRVDTVSLFGKSFTGFVAWK